MRRYRALLQRIAELRVAGCYGRDSYQAPHLWTANLIAVTNGLI
jgi:hypothetical protein